MPVTPRPQSPLTIKKHTAMDNVSVVHTLSKHNDSNRKIILT